MGIGFVCIKDVGYLGKGKVVGGWIFVRLLDLSILVFLMLFILIVELYFVLCGVGELKLGGNLLLLLFGCDVFDWGVLFGV